MNATKNHHFEASGSARLAKNPFVILQIEDSPDDRELFQMAAAQAKLPIAWQTAGSTKQAISHLQDLLDTAATGEPVTWPDLVLLDFLMPVENGTRVLEFIRSHASLRHVPVVVLTGSEDEAIAEQATRLGARAVLLKPSNFEGLVDLVSSLYRAFGTVGLTAIGISSPLSHRKGLLHDAAWLNC